MSTKRVILDADGVLFDFIGPVLHIASSVTGRHYEREDVHAFDFAACLELTPDQRKSVLHFMQVPGWWERLPVFADAIAGVRALEAICDVWVCTSPWHSCRTWESERRTALSDRFGINRARVIVADHKYVLAGFGDFLVDDRTSHLEAWRDAQRGSEPIQWITPHNRRDGWSGRATNNWQQLAEWIRGKA